jgi:hypothetical protein
MSGALAASVGLTQPLYRVSGMPMRTNGKWHFRINRPAKPHDQQLRP